jgi:hypothetical protein
MRGSNRVLEKVSLLMDFFQPLSKKKAPPPNIKRLALESDNRSKINLS